MITLREIRRSNGGRRLEFRYGVAGSARRFFVGCDPFFAEYDEDLSACPDAIAVVPFLANVLPIGWFGGFRIRVEVPVDANFAAAEPELLSAYREMYPRHGLVPALEVVRTQSVSWEGAREILLFSGGVDSTATLIALADRDVELLTVHGGDLGLPDEFRWNARLSALSRHPLAGERRARVVRSNLKTFYGSAVQSLQLGWWGRVQHGPGSLGLAAPVAWARGARRVHFSSSIMSPWGSTPRVDESVRYGPVVCVHFDDGNPRLVKLRRIFEWATQRGIDLDLPVCLDQGRNCGRCDKCLTTMVLLVSLGVDPRRFGVPMAEDAYETLFREMSTRIPSQLPLAVWPGTRDAAADALERGDFFVRSDRARERAALERIAGGEVDRMLRRARLGFDEPTEFALQYRFPRAYRSLWRVRQLLRGKASQPSIARARPSPDPSRGDSDRKANEA